MDKKIFAYFNFEQQETGLFYTFVETAVIGTNVKSYTVNPLTATIVDAEYIKKDCIKCSYLDFTHGETF